MAPRLIVMTRHRGIAGPYHRNGAAMLDVFYGLRGDEARLRETIERYDIGYVLICPGMSESKGLLRVIMDSMAMNGSGVGFAVNQSAP